MSRADPFTSLLYIEKREKFARRLNRYTQIRNSGHKIAKETKEKPIQF
jgi:hypothetical protein